MVGMVVNGDGRVDPSTPFVIPLGLLVFSLTVLITLRSLKSLIACPYMLILDNAGDCYKFPTRFRQNVST